MIKIIRVNSCSPSESHLEDKSITGKFVTAKLLGEKDCRQGWVTSEVPPRIIGQSGKVYLCGNPVTASN